MVTRMGNWHSFDPLFIIIKVLVIVAIATVHEKKDRGELLMAIHFLKDLFIL